MRRLIKYMTNVLSQRISTLFKSRFAHNVALTASGTALAQAINLAVSPIITRIYGPEAFGALGSFTAIVSLLGTVSALSYPIAIVLPASNQDAIGLARLSLVLTMVTALCLSIVCIAWYDPILDFFNLQTLGRQVFFLVPAVVGAGMMSVTSHWLIRNHRFHIEARIKVMQAIWINTAKVGFGIIWPISAVLIGIAAIASFLHSLLVMSTDRSLAYSVFDPKQLLQWCRSKKTPMGLARRYLEFPFYRTPQNLINSLSQNMPILLLGGLFGLQVVGFYALARSVLAAPVQLIGNSVKTVFFARISSAKNHGEPLQPLILRSVLGLTALGSLPFGATIAFGPTLFAYLFGASWREAGEYSQWLSIWLMFAIANRPCVSAIPVLQLEKFMLLYEVALAISRALSILAPHYFGYSALDSIRLFSVVGALFNATLIPLVSAVATKSDNADKNGNQTIAPDPK